MNRSTAVVLPEIDALPKFVEDHHDGLIVIPIRIVAIIVVGLLIRFLIHRSIDRLTRTTAGNGTPRLLKPLKEKAAAVSLFENSAILSERRRQRAETLGSVLRSATSITIFVIVFLLVLSEVGLDLAPFIAGTSIIGVALGFGAQNIVKDFLNGMFMLFEDQYGVGDVIDVKEATGTVEAVGLRTTRLRDVNGTVWYMRNGEIIRVGNKSQQYATVVLDITMDPKADIPAATAAMETAARSVYDDDGFRPLFLGEPQLAGVEELTRDQVTVRLTARVRPLEQWKIAREMRRRMWDRFDTLGITIADARGVKRRHPEAAQASPATGELPAVGGATAQGDDE